MAEESIDGLLPLEEYLRRPQKLPIEDTPRWFILCRIRNLVKRGEMPKIGPEALNQFLMAIPPDHRFALLIDRVEDWGRLGRGRGAAGDVKGSDRPVEHWRVLIVPAISIGSLVRAGSG